MPLTPVMGFAQVLKEVLIKLVRVVVAPVDSKLTAQVVGVADSGCFWEKYRVHSLSF